LGRPVYQKLESLISGKNPDVPVTQSAGGLGGELNSTDIGMTFGKGIVKQGKPFEAYVQSNLPQGTLDLNSIKGNFSTFDHLTPDGIAVSTKTLDTSVSSYQNPSKITYQLNKYINQMINFKRDGNDVFELTSDMIFSKQMQLGIPATASKEQFAAIAKSIQYAQSKGISVVITKVK
jgi:filamentous hemagglutinin